MCFFMNFLYIYQKLLRVIKNILTILFLSCTKFLYAQYLNPNGYPLITEPIISYKTVDHHSEGFLVTLDSVVFHFFRLRFQVFMVII